MYVRLLHMPVFPQYTAVSYSANNNSVSFGMYTQRAVLGKRLKPTQNAEICVQR